MYWGIVLAMIHNTGITVSDKANEMNNAMLC